MAVSRAKKWPVSIFKSPNGISCSHFLRSDSFFANVPLLFAVTLIGFAV